MSQETLKFDNAEVNKKEFHVSKQAITLNLVNENQVLISDKFEHSYKYLLYNKYLKVLNILLVTKKMIISADFYILYYLK